MLQYYQYLQKDLNLMIGNMTSNAQYNNFHMNTVYD